LIDASAIPLLDRKFFHNAITTSSLFRETRNNNHQIVFSKNHFFALIYKYVVYIGLNRFSNRVTSLTGIEWRH